MPSIYACDAATIRRLDDRELIKLDRRIHKIWKSDLIRCSNDHRMGKLMSALSKVHTLVVEELRRRGFKHDDGGPVLPKRTQKLMTEFGEFIRKVPVDTMPAVIIPKEKADAIIKGDISHLLVPFRPELIEVLDGAVGKFVVVANDRALGLAQMMVPGQRIGKEQFVPNSIKLGDAEQHVSVGIIFTPFDGLAEVKLAGNGPLLRAGSIESKGDVIEKRAIDTFGACLFNEDGNLVVLKYDLPAVLLQLITEFAKADSGDDQLEFEERLQESRDASKALKMGKFVLQRRWWVTKAEEASTWHLRFDWGGRFAPALTLQSDPAKGRAEGAYDDHAAMKLFDRTGSFPAGQLDEPRPEGGSATIDQLDSGKAELLDAGDGSMRVRLLGQKLSGEFKIKSEDGSYHIEQAVAKSGHFAPFVHKAEVAKENGEKQRLVYGVVYAPYAVDAQGDWADEPTIEKAAHRWMLESQGHKIMHQLNTDDVRVVESYLAPQDIRIGDAHVDKGSWVLVTKIMSDELWKKIETGEYTGYSLGGRANAHDEAPPRV